SHSLGTKVFSTYWWVRALIVLGLMIVQASLGAATECPEQQRAATNREEGLATMLQTYMPQLNLIIPKVLHAAHRRTDTVKFCYSTDEDLFSVYADGAGSNVVHVNLGGLQPIDISADAFAFAMIDLKDSGWWLNYLFYLRSQRHKGPVSVEPQELAG